MPDDISLKIDIADLTKILAGLPVSLENKGSRRATRAAAKVVLADAKSLAPHDTGALERSLKVKARRRSRRNKGTVGHRVVTSEQEAVFGGEQFYGAFRELGTKFQDPDPFLRPALFGNQEEVLRAYRNALEDWLVNDAPKAGNPQQTKPDPPTVEDTET